MSKREQPASVLVRIVALPVASWVTFPLTRPNRKALRQTMKRFPRELRKNRFGRWRTRYVPGAW